MSRLVDPVALCALLDIPFSDDQLGAITAPPDATQAIIAGAGSGKTTVMAARVVWLVGHHGVDPARILGLTFTNKAAGELGQRIRSALATLDLTAEPGEEPGEPTVSTYHAFAGTLITEFGLLRGHEPDLRVLADASRFQLAARAVATYDGRLHEISTHTPTLVLNLLGLESQLSEHVVDTDTLREHDQRIVAAVAAVPVQRGVWKGSDADSISSAARRRIELTRLVDRYRELKVEHGLMDFSDQMRWGAELAQLPEVGQTLRERFDVVLLDEYQDTSVAQHRLLRGLFTGHGVTAVGDPAQSIYGWRGAAADNLLGFLDDFPQRDGTRGLQHSLHVTRRCAPEVISLANRLAEPFYASTHDVRPLEAAPDNRPGQVSAALHHTVQDEIHDLVDRVVACHADGVEYRQIAVLVRVAAENGALVEALRAAGVPVEVVGLTGLLHQPEVRDTLSVLELLHDVTANPAAIRLLTGPRWRLGARDLALLGRRAAALGRQQRPAVGDETPEQALQRELDAAVAGVDPTDIVSLAEALDDPGDLPYSAEARARFAELSSLLRTLRGHLGDPLVDLARRVVSALDLDVELLVRPDGIGPDNISALLDAVASYAENDRYADLAGLMAYLEAEDDYAGGLEVASPSEADSVKVLTAHRSKGLEYEAVFVPLLSTKVFPNTQGRPRWIGTPVALPVSLRGDAASLPDVGAWTIADLDAFKKAWSAEALLEENRLAYVAFTRAKRLLHLSAHHWGRTQKEPRGPSPFLLAVREWLHQHDLDTDVWADAPEAGAGNPFSLYAVEHAWPAALGGLDRRREAAALVRAHQAGDAPEPPAGPVDEAARVRLTEIDDQLDLLLAEASERQSSVREVDLPEVLSASATLALLDDEPAFLRQLARPLPRRPSAAARFGTRFHARIEAHYGRQALLDPADLPGAGDAGIGTDAELEELVAAFAAGEYGGKVPAAVEAPFSLRLGGRQVIGRIDAVFAITLPDGSAGFEVVDWKTNVELDADPVQLAVYRLGWAEQQQVPVEQVVGAFHYVRHGRTVRPTDLPDRAALDALLQPPD